MSNYDSELEKAQRHASLARHMVTSQIELIQLLESAGLGASKDIRLLATYKQVLKSFDDDLKALQSAEGFRIPKSMPSVVTSGEMECSRCKQKAPLAWIEDGDGIMRARLPEGFHVETRPGLGKAIVCDRCDEVMLPP